MNSIPHPASVPPVNAATGKRRVYHRDPLIKAARKAYRESATGELDALLADRSRWSRKLTIAQNKLEAANFAIIRFCKDLANEKDGVKE